jgi:hypothetical protein
MCDKWTRLKEGDRFNLCYTNPNSESGKLVHVSIRYYEQKPDNVENYACWSGENKDRLYVSFVPEGQLGLPKILVQTITKRIPKSELPDMEMFLNGSDIPTLTYYYSPR